MIRPIFTHLIFLFWLSQHVLAQEADSVIYHLHRVPSKYLFDIDKKVKRYHSSITISTEKSLIKLSRWETRIKIVLQKASPETAERLFGNHQLTFTLLLEKLKTGDGIFLQYQATYNKYRDDLATSLKYLSQQKEQLDSALIKTINATCNKMQLLAAAEGQSEALQQFIRKRRQQLLEQAIRFIGSVKYLGKINKEAYYYAETLKNYKELFSESKKAEEAAKKILNRIPAFQQFMQKNSQLASLFGQAGGVAGTASQDGLQTRASVQSLIQDRITAGGSNAWQAFNQNMQAAQAELTNIKEKILRPGTADGERGDIPEFKPRQQKATSFIQRLEVGLNLQFAKTTTLLPATSDLAVSVGYKVNHKSVIGLGASYRLGMGTIQHIHFSHEGIGLRSFVDWKLKKQFFIIGGYELNHNSQFENFAQLKNYNAWQRSALMGLSKKISINTKLFKGTNIQLLYDFLSNQHIPVSQSVLCRVGYNF